jgi:hypothetical protein
VGGNITISGAAQVVAAGGSFATGIGSGRGSNSVPENTVITITDNAKVYAKGGLDSAGIGGSDGGAKITIGTGSDYPIVIAKGATATNSTNSEADSACGIGAGGASTQSTIQIEIKSGFVAAQSNRPNGQGIGINPNWDTDTSYVKITGGSVYAINTVTPANLVSPTPKNGSSTAVYPLYASGALAPKTINVTSPAYSTKAISKGAAEMLIGSNVFFGDVATDLFPTALSAVLWLPTGDYSGITTTPSSADYYATVNAALVPYTEGMGGNRLLQ